ncbi:MAG: DUF1365 domain-containing protein [Proteobacteria bacterium]|nr:DUF1365 domain-containing protein [Pseudomonadota bacterium]
MNASLQSCLYVGRVMHHRLAPRRHRFSYRAMTMLFDLDELPVLDRRFALFGHNRARPIAFHDADHGPGDGSDLRSWVEGHMAAAGMAVPGGPIRILCLPRLLGYAFNPISVWFCFDPDERLAAVLYEVANTFGEKRSYLLPVEDPDAAVLRQGCAKGFHVSPFLPVAGDYRFRLSPPGARMMLQIRHVVEGRTRLVALQTGARVALENGGLVRALLRFPLMTAKVIAAIHFEALRLWLKRMPFHPHRRATAPEVMGVGT